MRAAVVIPVRNGAAFLGPCLRALLDQQGADFTTIAVDNGSSDGSADLVAADFPGVRLIRNDRPLGFAGAVNVGIRAALAGGEPPEAIVLLNQDTVAHPGWLAALLAPLERDSQVGVAGCKALFPNGHIQHAGAEILWPLGYGRNRGYDARDDGQLDAEDSPAYVAFVGVALVV